MNKALEILKELKEYYSLVVAKELAKGKTVKKSIEKDLENINNRINDIDEAIAELKALEKTIKAINIEAMEREAMFGLEIEYRDAEINRLKKPKSCRCDEFSKFQPKGE